MAARKAKAEEARLKDEDPEQHARLLKARQGAADMMAMFDTNLADMQGTMVCAESLFWMASLSLTCFECREDRQQPLHR